MGAHVHYSRRRGIDVEASECHRCGAYRTPFKPLTRQRRKRLAPGDEKLVCYPLSASAQWPNQGFWRGGIGGAEAAKCVFPVRAPYPQNCGPSDDFFWGGESCAFKVGLTRPNYRQFVPDRLNISSAECWLLSSCSLQKNCKWQFLEFPGIPAGIFGPSNSREFPNGNSRCGGLDTGLVIYLIFAVPRLTNSVWQLCIQCLGFPHQYLGI